MFIRNKIYSKPFWISLLWKQNEYHKHGVLVHTLKVLFCILKNKDYKFIATAIFHDIGKPFVAYQKLEDIQTKEYSFTDHEEWTKNMIRYHYILRDISKCKKENMQGRLKEKEAIFTTFDKDFINDLKTFLKYDDCGKGN